MESKNLTKFVLLVAFIFAFSACKIKTEIKGDIFLEKGGAAGAKLANVQVIAVPESTAKPYLDSKKVAFDALDNEYKNVTAVNNTDENSHKKAEIIRENLDDLTGAELYREMPNGAAAATSDVDGKFMLTLPKAGKYLIAAASGGNYWYMWIEADGRPKSVMLTNNNQISSYNFQILFVN